MARKVPLSRQPEIVYGNPIYEQLFGNLAEVEESTVLVTGGKIYGLRHILHQVRRLRYHVDGQPLASMFLELLLESLFVQMDTSTGDVILAVDAMP